MNTKTETSTTDQTLIERLFSVGAHFGFSKSRRHPTVTPYLFGSKQGTDILDLEKTSILITEAKKVLKEAGAAGKTILFVGTKEEIATIVEQCAKDAGMPYVTNRWIGGALTNFTEIKKRIARLIELAEQNESGELERKYTKKERVLIGREFDKLNLNFGGIKELEKIPQILLVIDPRHNHIAVSEAHELGIPVIGITSTDADLSVLAYPVVVNDSLQSSVAFVLKELTDSLVEGKATHTATAEEKTEKKEEK